MSFLNPLFAALLILFAVLSVQASFNWAKASPDAGRFGTIDGLRGYLAFFVFLHHAAIWVTYSQTGAWQAPDSHLYTHLGQSSVAVFFMITSFLFYDKLLNAGTRTIAWRSFLTGRFFRLMPLYATVMLVMFLVVALLSDATLHDKPRYLFFCAVRWLSFTILGAPDINHVDAARIVAGVTWSLPYEWCFYLLLPLLALGTGQRPTWRMLVVIVAGLATAWSAALHWHLLCIFAGGMLAARLVRHAPFTAFARRPLASAIVVACLGLVLLFPTAYAFLPAALLTIAFCLVAAGADLFGVLAAKASRRFGELAYSMYLIHGILLFSAITFVVGKGRVAAMSGMHYWMVIALLVPVLLALSALTYHSVEQPGIRLGRRFSARWPGKQAAQPGTDPMPAPVVV